MQLRRWAWGAGAAIALTLAGGSNAHAATYTVDNIADVAGVANCMPAVPNDCPLRGAVQNANLTMANDEIVLTVNPQLQINGTDENLNATDDIDVNATSGGALTIRSDTGVRTISRALVANNFRILDVSGGSNTVTLQNVEITGGNSATVGNVGGGGLRFTGFNPAAVLRLDNVYLHDNIVGSGNNTARGGGLAASGQGLVEVTNGSRIEGNRAANGIAGSQGFGGGISVLDAVDLTVTGSTIRDNRAGSGGGPTEGRGGGIYLFNSQPVTADLTITGSTIDQNRAGGLGSAGGLYSGGGIHAESQGGGAALDVAISGGALSANTAGGGSGNSNGFGGGVRVFSQSGSGGGALTVDGVSVTGNRAGGSDGSTNPVANGTASGFGAGISSNADTGITGSTISGNRAAIAPTALNHSGFGGGLHMEDFTAAPPDLAIAGSRFEDNRTGNGAGGSGEGGAINAGNEGALTISNSIVAGNQGLGSGGAIVRSINGTGPADSITDTSITGNVAGQGGGGISLSTPRFFTIDRSLVSGNAASQFGGGISATSTFGASPLGRLRLRNSTVTANTAGLDTPTGSLLAAGGGIFLGAAEETDFQAVLSTIASNTVFSGTMTDGQYGRGGNIRIFNDLDPGSPLTSFTGTIVSGGAGTGTGASAPNCSLGVGITTTSAGGNLEGPDSGGTSTTSCGFTNTGLGDQTGVNPLLGALADNGGPTQTRALLPGSPALNAVPAAVCTSTTLTTDQRGLPRPFPGGQCDVGAYELGDRDGDGLLDTSDNCPTQAGPASNGGCPLAVVQPPIVQPTPPVTTPKCPKGKKSKVVKGKRKCVKKKRKKKK